MVSKGALRSLAAVASIALVSAGTGANATNQHPTSSSVKSTDQAIVGGDRSKTRQGFAIVGGDEPNAIVGGDRSKTRQGFAIVGGDEPNAIVGGDRSKTRQGFAIVGGDEPNAIVGGDRAKTRTDYSDLKMLESAIARGLIVHGPIDNVNVANGIVSVAGQPFAAHLRVDGLRQLNDRLLSGEAILASVFGSITADGQLSPRSMVLSHETYVPGTTSVVVVGKVRMVDSRVGRFTLGNLVVDHASALSSAECSRVITAGARVALIGVMHAADSPLVASQIESLDGCR